MLVDYPAGLTPISGGFAPAMKTLGGGQALSGYEQVVSSFSDRWQASFSFPVRNQAHLLALRSFVTRMRGRSNSVYLPAFECGRGPYAPAPTASPIGQSFTAAFFKEWPSLAATDYRFSPLVELSGAAVVRSASTIRLSVAGGVPATGIWVEIAGAKRRMSDVSLVAAGVYDATVSPGFALTKGARTAPAARLLSAASLNDAQVSVEMVVGASPQPGQLFSVGNRLYAIDAVSNHTFDIWPWMRGDVAAGAVVNFVNPCCEMRFASDAEGADVLKGLNLLRFGTATLNFDEVA